MIASDLLHDPKRRSYGAMPEMDALTEEGALQEAALIDARFIVAESTVALLFDLRLAIQLRLGNTGILIVHELRKLEWVRGASPSSHRVWHAVTGSIPDNRDGRFSLRIGLAPDAELRLEGDSAEFYVGDVPGLSETPPDFMEDSEEEISAAMPSWDAKFVPSFATFLDPADSRSV